MIVRRTKNLFPKIFYTNGCLNGGIDCPVEFAQNENSDASKLTLVKNDVLRKFCQ